LLYGPLEVLTLTFIYCAKARAFADGVGIVVTQAYAIATMLMTGNVVMQHRHLEL
jgi:hypothetical protein